MRHLLKEFENKAKKKLKFPLPYVIIVIQFFPLALAHGLLHEFERQQVSSSLQDFLCFLGDINNTVVCMVSACFLISNSSYLYVKSFGECSERTNYNWYHRHLHDPQLFQFPDKVLVLVSFSFLFILTLWFAGWQSPLFDNVSFLVIYHKLWSSVWDYAISLSFTFPERCLVMHM